MNGSEYTSGTRGPREKCDQVIYEAIAKAAEIIVHGRCQNENKGESQGNNNSTSRFHLEIEEVANVRSILKLWKSSLHVPLRLDVFYQYSSDPNDPENSTRKELLERWCIDYIHTSNSMDNSHGGDETIAQLRHVVKRAVIQLRVLHSLTRIMPAYKLHHALSSEENHMTGGANVGGYYNMGQQQINHVSKIIQELVGGSINYSFYVSDTVAPNQRRHTDTTLFSSSTNRPFSKHELSPIPTPFGILYLSVQYDEYLNVKSVLHQRTQRMLECCKSQSGPMQIPNNRIDGRSNNDSRHTQYSQSIPIKIHSYNPKGTNDSRSMHMQQFHDRPQFSKQMSMPNQNLNALNLSPNVKTDYMSSTQFGQIERPKSAEPGKINITERLRSNSVTHPVQKSKKNLSGLSLALMDEEANKDDDFNACNLASVKDTSERDEDIISRRQRMAFHHPPPSFDEISDQIPGHLSKGSYGYGYNTGNVHQESLSKIHINNIRKSPNTVPITNTPPQPMFLSSTPRPVKGVSSPLERESTADGNNAVPFTNPTSLQTSNSVHNKNSIGSITFQENLDTNSSYNRQIDHTNKITKDSILPPLHTEDALASSPFKLVISQNIEPGKKSLSKLSHSPNVSIFSSLIGKGSTGYAEGFPIALGNSAVYTSNLSNRTRAFSGRLTKQLYTNDTEDMPFAVDMDDSNNSTSILTAKTSRQNSGMEFGNSFGNTSSLVVSSLAHKCSTGAERLKLFNSTQSMQKQELNYQSSFVDDQLKDFRSFGDSIATIHSTNK